MDRDKVIKHSRRVIVTLNEYEKNKLNKIIETTGETKAGVLKRIFNTYISSSMTFKSE